MALFGSRLAKLAQFLATAGTVPETAISTAETDTDLRLAPDGAGGVEWGTGGGGGGGRIISNTSSIIEDECYGIVTLAGNVTIFPANTGGSGVTAGEAGHPGILDLHTGTNAAGRAVAITSTATYVLLGASVVRFGIVAKFFGLVSDGTDRYTTRMGLGDSSGGEHTDGVFFRQVDNVNGGNWEGIARSNGSETPVDTGVAPDLNWHLYEFEVNAAGTSVEFFIDEVSVGTVAATIPTGAGRQTSFNPAGIIKSVGANRRDLFVDAYWYHFDFTARF